MVLLFSKNNLCAGKMLFPTLTNIKGNGLQMLVHSLPLPQGRMDTKTEYRHLQNRK